MQKIAIGIAEDNVLALKSILKKLENFEDIEVSLIAKNGIDLIEQYQQKSVDVILIDIEMPILDGITATTNLKNIYPESKIVMLTTIDGDEKIFNAILADAAGYLLKDEDTFVIHKSILDVYEGNAAMSADIALKTLNYIKKSSFASSSPTVENILSQREMDNLKELKNGLSFKQIADRLSISEGTVWKHIENIYRKLQVNNKVSTVNIAMDNKWL